MCERPRQLDSKTQQLIVIGLNFRKITFNRENWKKKIIITFNRLSYHPVEIILVKQFQ